MSVSRPQSYKKNNVVYCTTRQEAKTSWMLTAPHLSPSGHKVNYKPFISSSNSVLTSAPKIIGLRETRP